MSKKPSKTSLITSMVLDYLKKNPDGATTAKVISDLMVTDKLTVYQVLHRLKLRQELIRNEFTQVWRIPFAQMLTAQTSSPIPHLRQFDALAKALDMEIGNVLDIAMKCLVRDLRDVVTKECTYGR